MAQLALLSLPDAVLERIVLLAARRSLRDGEEGASRLPVELLPVAETCRRLRAAVGAACVELRFTPRPAGAVREPRAAGKGIDETLLRMAAWIRLAGPALRRVAFVERISYDSCAERVFRVIQNCGAPVQELNLTGMAFAYASDMSPIKRLLTSLRMSLCVLKIWLKDFHTAALAVANSLAAAKLVKLHTFGVHNLPENAFEANPFALFVLLDSVSARTCRPDGARLRTLLLTFRERCQLPGFARSGRGHACSYPGLSELVIDSYYGHDVLRLLDGVLPVMPDLRRLSLAGAWLHKKSVEKVVDCCKNLDELRLNENCALTPVEPFNVWHYVRLEGDRTPWNPQELTTMLTESGGKITSLCLSPDVWLRLRIEDLVLIADSCPRLKCLNIRLDDGAPEGLPNMCFALRDTLESLTICNGERDGSTIVDQLHGLTVADAIKQTRCLRDLALVEFPFSPSVLADMIKYAGAQLRTCSIRAWNGFVPMHMRYDASIIAGRILDSVSENNRGLHRLSFTSPVDDNLKVKPSSPQGAMLVTAATKLLRVAPCLDIRDVTELMGHYLTEVPPVTC